MAKDTDGNRINIFGEITGSFDFEGAAAKAGMTTLQYWREVMAPLLRTLPQHTRKALKDRAEAVLTDLVPSARFGKLFRAFLLHPSDFPWRTVGLEHGTTRRYLAVRLLSYLERHLNEGGHLPYSLETYLAEIIPGRINDEYLAILCRSLQYPLTLGKFPTHQLSTKAQQAKAAAKQRRQQAKGVRFATPWSEYQHVRREAYHQRVTQLATLLNPPNNMPLKTFAVTAWTANPLSPTKRKPNLAAVMQYIAQHLAPHLTPSTLTRITTEGQYFANHLTHTTPPDVLPETKRRLTAMLFDDPIDRRRAA